MEVMETDIKISVVIPAHNNARTIGRALESVYAQSFSPEEIIVVNDASADETREILSGHTAVTLLERDTPGPGGYAARNAGVEHARGEWIAFLDADDAWHPDYLASVSELVRNNPEAGFICSGWINRISDTRQIPDDYTSGVSDPEAAAIFGGRRFFDTWISAGPLVWTSAVTVRKSVIKAAGLFPLGRCKRGGDIDTWVRIILSGTPLYRIGKPLATYYRDVEGSVTKRSISQMKTCSDLSIRKFLAGHPDLPWKRSLMRFSNTMKMNGFKMHARHDRVVPSDLRMLYPSATPLFFLLCIFFAYLPSPLVRTAFRLLKPEGGGR